MLKVFFLSFFLIFSNYSFGSAWLVEKGKFKIIPQLEFKKFHEVLRNSHDYEFTRAEINYLKVNLEYGISHKQNLLGEVNLSTIHTGRYTYNFNQEKLVSSWKSERFLALPDVFDSASIGIRSEILKRKSAIISNDINLKFFGNEQGEEFEFDYKLAYGNSFLVGKKDLFIQAEYLFNFNPVFHNYDNKLIFSIGYKKTPKKMYILSVENYFKTNYYNHFLDKKVKLHNNFYETRVQITTATKINKKVSFQKSVFTTINRLKNFSSSGINIGLWFNL